MVVSRGTRPKTVVKVDETDAQPVSPPQLPVPSAPLICVALTITGSEPLSGAAADVFENTPIPSDSRMSLVSKFCFFIQISKRTGIQSSGEFFVELSDGRHDSCHSSALVFKLVAELKNDHAIGW